MSRRSGQSHLFLYLLLNVIVSAATVLAVLLVWERVRQNELPPQVPTNPAPVETSGAPAAQVDPTATLPPAPTPTTAQPSSGPLIQITSVIGATDPQQEYVVLKRLGEGDLSLAGWQLRDEEGNVYIFPSSPELILFKGGAVQVYTRVGNDTPAEVFWNRADPVWRPGEWVTLVDSLGSVQATFQVP
jgi:hypothetical protein